MELQTKISIMKKVMKITRRPGTVIHDWEWNGMKMGVSKEPGEMTERDVEKLCRVFNFDPEDHRRAELLSKKRAQRKPNIPRGIDPNKFCLCGCGNNVSSKARFVPGHDSKLKKQLRLLIAAGDKDANRYAFELGWMGICREIPD